MDNVLEQQRKLHEERERLEDAVAKESLLKKGTVSTNNHLKYFFLLSNFITCTFKMRFYIVFIGLLHYFYGFNLIAQGSDQQ